MTSEFLNQQGNVSEHPQGKRIKTFACSAINTKTIFYIKKTSTTTPKKLLKLEACIF